MRSTLSIVILLALALFVNAFSIPPVIATTDSGKKVVLKEDWTWYYIDDNSVISDSVEKDINYVFRNTNWGMTKEQIKQSESVDPAEEGDNYIAYQDMIGDMSCNVVYIFSGNLLTRARYLFTNTHANQNDFIMDYEKVKGLLKKKYGDPKDQKEQIWKDNLYKNDPQHWGMAIGTGRLIYRNIWNNSTTEIVHALYGDNYTIYHLVEYCGNRYKDLEQAESESEQLEKF